MPLKSSGIMLFKKDTSIKVFLVHSGGPFWAKKDLGTWSIPKGLVEEGEDLRSAAIREVKEEIGIEINVEVESLIDLGSIKQTNKTVFGFGAKTNLGDIETHSNTTYIEWPPKSGKKIEIPEIDRGEWFDLETARIKINPHQAPFIERLIIFLSSNPDTI